jgi:hypothetical protein
MPLRYDECTLCAVATTYAHNTRQDGWQRHRAHHGLQH